MVSNEPALACRRRSSSERDALAAKLDEADSKLGEARAARKENQRDKENNAALQDLKATFPGRADYRGWG